MTRKTYLIREGSFSTPEGVKGPGDTIDLDSDVAAAHAGRIVEVKDNDGKAVAMPGVGAAAAVDRFR